jgi:hypothetical protein
VRNVQDEKEIKEVEEVKECGREVRVGRGADERIRQRVFTNYDTKF